MIKLSTLRLAGLLVAIALPAVAQEKSDPGKVLNSLFADRIVASGKGFEVKRSLLDDVYINYKSEMAGRGQDLPESSRPTVESNILEHIILNKILVQKATVEEKTRIKELVDQAIEGYRKAAPSPEVFNAQIKAAGTSLQQMTDRAFEEQLAKTVLLREVVPSNAVSDEAIKKFYTENPAKFAVPEQARIAHILFSVLDASMQQPLPASEKQAKEKLAKEVQARAAKGEDFAKLAKQYTDDAATKETGGEVTLARGVTRVPELEAAAFSLKTNQVSDLVETAFGYHIVKLLEKIPASTAPLDKVSPRIKEYLSDLEVNKALPAYSVKLNAEYEVKTFGLTNAPATAPVPAPPTGIHTTPPIEKK